VSGSYERPRPPSGLATARAALADEWRAKQPRTPGEVQAFYRQSQAQAADQAAWHATPGRRRWTALLVATARQSGARRIVDVGCGSGYDLRALREALGDEADLTGVEPNERQRNSLPPDVRALPDVAQAPIEAADLLVCIDVLEHLPGPEAFLAGLAGRARLGALLFESTATHDHGTPLHLPRNRGWHPARCLEAGGWRLLEEQGRARVWQRVAPDS
jgi:2-polyprenyl-3-methyl-5-hydroxy-6-metoxy-1,4-benzoquinol methylase